MRLASYVPGELIPLPLSGSIPELPHVEKVESCAGLNFGENLKRTGIADSHSRSRAAEVAYEFSVRQRGPSGPYAKTAPKSRRISDLLCKATFSTVSAQNGRLGVGR